MKKQTWLGRLIGRVESYSAFRNSSGFETIRKISLCVSVASGKEEGREIEVVMSLDAAEQLAKDILKEVNKVREETELS